MPAFGGWQVVTAATHKTTVGMIAMGLGPGYSGGAEYQAGLLASELARTGRRVLLYAPAVSISEDDRLHRPGFRIVPVPCLGLPRTRTVTFLPMLALMQIAPGFEHPPILHTHMAWYQALVPELIKRARGVRTVVKFACSGSDGEITALSRSRLGRIALAEIRNADRVVALTSAVAEELRSAGFPADRIRRIPNGVAAPQPAHPSPDLADVRHPAVLFAGRLSHQKGILPFLDAWDQVVEAVEHPTLIIAGTGPLDAQVRERAARSLVGGQVRVLGHRTDIDSLLATADAVVIPSRSEGMSNVALQALAASKPVFGFAIPGVQELVLDRRALASPGDQAQLADLLIRGLRSPSMLRELGLGGRDHVRRSFSIPHVASLYEEVYDELS